MLNVRKKWLSLLLVIAMLLSLAPAAYATEDTGSEAVVPLSEATGESPAPADASSQIAEGVTDTGTETAGSNADIAAEPETDIASSDASAEEGDAEAVTEPEGQTPSEADAGEETGDEPEEDGLTAEDGVEGEELEAMSTGSYMTEAGLTIVSLSNNSVANGVSYQKIVTRNAENQQNIGFLTEVDLSKNVKILATYNDYYTSGSTAESRAASAANLGWSFSTTTDLAQQYKSIADAKGTVVMATNADYFNMSTGEPSGYLIMEGNAIKTTGEPYFAILKDGTAVIRDAGTDCSDVQEAISGRFYLIKDGVEVTRDSDGQAPRNSVGIRADGSVVFFENDGRQAPTSVGMTYSEVAGVLLDAGCVTALNLDGGGSATVAARLEGTDSLTIINSPSDGHERETSSAVLIISTEESTGIFDHAAVSPRDELYTPKSEIQFTASGVDSAGASAEIPLDVTWALAESSKNLGTIDEKTGLFTANDGVGTVTVELRQGTNVVGTASIEIVTPDEISFNTDEVSLGFDDTTDLGLVVRNEGRDIIIKDGDIVWTMSDNAMGTFEGNSFTSSDGKSLNGDITATSAFNSECTATIHVIVGMLPTLVWDFEDVVNEDGTVTSAEEYYGSILTHSNYGRGGNESFEIVSIDDGEPVRFGEHSLKLNYDFSQCGEVTEGACIGTTEKMEIPGMPTGIGVWVYAPEGVGVNYDGTVSGLWLRGYVLDGNGSTMPYDFTFEPKSTVVQNGYDAETGIYTVQPGIYWEGWMYLEADLTSMTGPFSIQKGMTFRLMFVSGTNMVGTQRTGSIYFDNLQFVYGTNVDDVDNPKVDSIAIGDTELTNGTVLTTDTFTVRTTFSDTAGKYASGVDASTVRMYVDGVNVLDNENYSFALNASDGYAELYNLTLADGSHSISVFLRDGFGNDTQETRYFTVQSGTAAPASVSVKPTSETAPLGGQVKLEIRSSGDAVAKNATTIRLSNMFPDVEVQFSDNYTGESTYTKTSATLTLNAQRKDGADAEDDLIATVVVKVPATLTENESFLFEVKSGSFTSVDGYYNTYSAPEVKLPVGTDIVISCDPILVGGDPGVIKVTDAEGKALAGVGIYLASDDSLIGTSDENGLLETNYFSDEAGKVTIYAKTEDGMLSFQYNVFIYDTVKDSEETPVQVLFNGTSDNATGKSLSWMSNPLDKGAQSLRYRAEGGSEEDWTTVEAESYLGTFVTGGNTASNINSVKLTGLDAGTTYEYQVGNGTTWSETSSFTVGSGSKFFVMADIQASDLTNVKAMIGNIKANGYNFGIQTGDAIDDVTSYTQVVNATQLFGTDLMGGMDLIHVLGNHEYYGDASANVASALYNLPAASSGSYYSLTYGDVYVAVINYTATDAELIAALDWLVKDAQSSSATWKVLTIHQPPYYTNASGGNAPVNTYVPAAVEKAGIDVVFSGHDHSLARTNPLTNGQIDEENGVLYYIGGSSGEKSYSITSQSIFDYETIFALATTDFSATYIGVSADSEKMVLEIYDVSADGSQKCVDSYTLYSLVGACAAEGHDLDNAVYGDGKLICNNCGTAIDPAEAKFTGWAVDKESGLSMYFVAGKYQTGEFLLDKTTYYFDENGVAYDGPVEVNGVKMEFNNGLLIGGYTGFVTGSDGNTYHYVEGKMTYGWLEIDGYWYHFDAATGIMCTETHVMPDDEAKSKKAYYDFDKDGKLLYGYFNPAGYYYWAGLPLYNSWVKPGNDPESWYRTNGSGHFVKDTTGNPTVLMEVDGVQYTFDNTNGKLLKGSIVNDNGTLYYYWAGEPVNDGWFEVDGNIYYAFDDGHLATGKTTIDTKTYTFSSVGVLISDDLIFNVSLSDDLTVMSIVLLNAGSDVKDVTFTATSTVRGAGSALKFAPEKGGSNLWTGKLAMCQFDLCTADVFQIQATGTKDGKEAVLAEISVDIVAAPTHVYSSESDDTCDVCGHVRRIDLSGVKTTPMYRMYNAGTGEHFYTGSIEERDGLVESGWNYEGVAWNAPVSGGTPVHRVFNPNSGDHHYTTSMSEVMMLLEAGWKYENICWNSAFSDAVPQYRMWNKNADLGSHHYTSSEQECEDLIAVGWKREGIGWYGLSK